MSRQTQKESDEKSFFRPENDEKKESGHKWVKQR